MTKDIQSTQPQTSSHHRRSLFWKGVAGGAAGSALIVGTALALGLQTPQPLLETAQPFQTVSAETALSDYETAITTAVKTAKDTVVSVGNYQTAQPMNYQYQYYFGEEFTSPESELGGEQLVGEGSGVIYKIDQDATFVVTNNHVVDGAQRLTVTMPDGTSVDAELIGTDVLTDLAVLKINTQDANATTAIKFADSDTLEVGTLAIAIGSPLGSEFSNSITQGIVSSAARQMPVDTNNDGTIDTNATLIQTDAAINPGNSGGALVNRNGDLIGINSSKMSSIGVEGMGFAIPSNEVKAIIEQLEAHGEVTRPVLGVQTRNVGELSSRAKTEILKLTEEQDTGVAVAQVIPNSSAEVGGIEQYDVIVQIDDTAVEDLSDLREALYEHQIGDTITVTVLREGLSVELDITLQAEQDATQTAPSLNE